MRCSDDTPGRRAIGNWPIKVSHKHGLRCGQMIWMGGQVDLTERGEIRHQGDLAAQIRK